MIKSKKYISKHNIIKHLKTKDKENILKAATEKLPIYEQDLNNWISHLLETKRKWNNIFQVLKEKTHQPWIL